MIEHLLAKGGLPRQPGTRQRPLTAASEAQQAFGVRRQRVPGEAGLALGTIGAREGDQAGEVVVARDGGGEEGEVSVWKYGSMEVWGCGVKALKRVA
jgi:hypothetical protein